MTDRSCTCTASDDRRQPRPHGSPPSAPTRPASAPEDGGRPRPPAAGIVRRMVAAVALGWLAVLAEPLPAQLPAPPQTGPIALTGGAIHTVTAGVIQDGTLLFEAGTITAIGVNVDLPSGTQVVPIDGKHVYPGLIDAWSQIGIYEIGAVPMTVDIVEQGRINPNVRAEIAFNPASRHIGVARSAGILTAVTSPAGGLISGQSAAMALDGWAWDEMVLKTAVGLIVQWPGRPERDEYAAAVRELRAIFADARAYQAARAAKQQGLAPHHDHDSRLEAMLPFLNGDSPVVVAADEVRQIQDAATWAEQEGLRLVILGGRDAHMVSGQLRDLGVPVIVTTVLASPARNWEPYDARYRLPAQLHQAGVTFAIAGAANAANANRLPHEAGAAAAFGLPMEEALKAVTLYPAAILGLNDRVGALEVGMDATLLVTDGNPLEYATRIEQVYVRGRESDMDDIQRQLYRRYRGRVQDTP